MTAEEIVAKLPKTKDGQPIYPGMVVWQRRSKYILAECEIFMHHGTADGYAGHFYSSRYKAEGDITK
jgi:hypothetical protein